MAGKRRRGNPALAVLNPPGGKLIGRGVVEVAYRKHHRRGTGGGAGWIHKYAAKSDVDARGLPDGRVVLASRAGRALWSGKAERWLDNPRKPKPRKLDKFDRDYRKPGDTRCRAMKGVVGPGTYPEPCVLEHGHRGPHLTASDRKANTVARRKRKKSSGTRRAKARTSTRRKITRRAAKRKPPKGFRSWAAYFQSIRPGKKKAATTHKGGTVKHRRRKSRGGRRRSNPAARSSRRHKARRHGRRSFRRNPVSGIVGTLMDGAKGGAMVVAGKVVARSVPALIGVQPVGLLGVAVQTGIGAAAALVGERFLERDTMRPFLYGVFANAIESIIRAQNIPVLTPALGDETELYGVAGYAHAPAMAAGAGGRLSGYAHAAPSLAGYAMGDADSI